MVKKFATNDVSEILKTSFASAGGSFAAVVVVPLLQPAFAFTGPERTNRFIESIFQ